MAVACFTPADWPERVRIATTTRSGGASRDPFGSFNLGDHVGDDAQAVAANRRSLRRALPRGVTVQWLSQEHGTRIVTASPSPDLAPVADGCWTQQPRLACAVLTADCLPVLLCCGDGRRVAAVHAGWRGLCAGVIEAAVRTLDARPADIHAWLGPAIGAEAFEVGAPVRSAFLEAAARAGRDQGSEARCFRPAGRVDHYFADLAGLACLRLGASGVTRVQIDGRCTFNEGETFFSYRRDGQTGRMASLIFIDGA